MLATFGRDRQFSRRIRRNHERGPERRAGDVGRDLAGYSECLARCGVNLAAAANNLNMRNLGAMSLDEKQRFMRRFCNQYPLKEYLDGVIELFKALPVSQPAR